MSVSIDAPRWRDGNKRQTALSAIGLKEPHCPQR
jgi:hypothetical protein